MKKTVFTYSGSINWISKYQFLTMLVIDCDSQVITYDRFRLFVSKFRWLSLFVELKNYPSNIGANKIIFEH